MSDPVLYVHDWDEHFENSRSRSMKEMRWAPIPNGFDGDKISELIEQGGAPAYGCFVAVVLVASKCQPRGRLVRANGRPHTAKTLARMTRLDSEEMFKALNLCLDIGLLRADGNPSPTYQGPDIHPEPLHQEPVTERNGTEGNGREGTEGKEPVNAPAPEQVAPLENQAEAEEQTEEEEGTGTGTPGLVQSRFHGKILFEAALEPLLGWEDGTRHPPKSPKYNRDLVCLDKWFNDRVWPEAQDAVGQVRLAQIVEEAKKAPKVSKNPMAYIGNKTKPWVQAEHYDDGLSIQ